LAGYLLKLLASPWTCPGSCPLCPHEIYYPPASEPIEQWERELAELATAQNISFRWLQAIHQAKQIGEQLAIMGYAVEGMEMTTTAAKLECNPPAEFLQILLDWPKLQ
jgi:hypothetical protein